MLKVLGVLFILWAAAAVIMKRHALEVKIRGKDYNLRADYPMWIGLLLFVLG